MSSRRIVIALLLIAAAGGAWRFRDRLGFSDGAPQKHVMLKVTGTCGTGVEVTAENRNPADIVRMSVRTRMLNAEVDSINGDETSREWTKRVPANGTAAECWTFHSRTRPGESPAFDLEATSVDLEK